MPSAAKTKGRVIVESDTARLAVERRGSRNRAEIIGPALVAVIDCAVTGSDRAVAASDHVKPAGSYSFNGWILELRDEHKFDSVLLSSGVVRSTVEHTSMKTMLDGLQDLAGHGLDVFVDTSAVVVQPLALTAAVLAALGSPVPGAPDYAIGEVTEITPTQAAAMPDVLAALDRGALLVTFNGPDRLIAKRPASSQHTTHWLYRRDRVQSASEFLRDVVLAHAPQLLVIEREAAERGELDLEAAAITHRIAVAVLPSAPAPGPAVTPQTMKEAHDVNA